jgi:hypothetical protein
MAGSFSAFLRMLLPGVFADAHHWKERALNAESRLSELISQMEAIFNSERQERRAEWTELMGRMRGDFPLPLPPSDDGRNGGTRPPVPRATNPIARAYEAARKQEAEMTDQLVTDVVDDILRMNAIVSPVNHDRGQ